jgi:hypothetical protein
VRKWLRGTMNEVSSIMGCRSHKSWNEKECVFILSTSYLNIQKCTMSSIIRIQIRLSSNWIR